MNKMLTRCALCGTPLSANAPTVRATPGNGEICWFCQQPEGFQRVSRISAAPILAWARGRFDTDIVGFEVSHVCASPKGYARFSHLHVKHVQHKYAVQYLGGNIEQEGK